MNYDESELFRLDDVIEPEPDVSMEIEAPVDQGPAIEAVLDHRIARISNGFDEEDEEDNEVTEYLVKWRGQSHLYNTWDSYDNLKWYKGAKRLDNYRTRVAQALMFRNDPSTTKEEIENLDIKREMERDELKDYISVERIIAQLQTENDVEYLVKWKRLAYSECTWEPIEMISDFQSEIDAFLDRNSSQRMSHKSASFVKNRPEFRRFTTQPDFIVGGELRDYQLLGVNWMAYLWHRNENGILADEMGLGKTVQAISFMNYLFQTQQVYGPFLVLVPLSTMMSWQNEFAKWAPEINLVVYSGDTKSRQIIREHEFYLDPVHDPRIKFNALLTSFELILKDRQELGRIRWAYLAVDEAHRLKNSASQLYEALKDFHTVNRLLITGTPLQNSVKELVALVRFLMPDKFREFEGFEIDVGADDQEDKIRDLQEKLRPFMLRRLKKDVEKSLPSKTERILRVELSQQQLQYYKSIYTRNYQALRGSNLPGQLSLLNICMELKKASNHPYLFDGAEQLDVTKEEQLKGLIMNSGKMVLLDKLLARLKEDGHRVLIFSQMVRMLDILHDYLVFRGYQHQRLDGSVGSEARKRAMEHFNKEDSPDFVFLLSTRAGGLGLNLSSADTVIIFDSDWNPQNDLQAMARAHRIGQKRTVNVYRFISKDTIEEEIIERAKRKMVLEYAIIKQMDTSGRSILSKDKSSTNSNSISKEELQTILKFGAQNLFKSHEENKESGVNLEQMDLDDILARAENTTDVQSMTEGESSEFYDQWRVADFGVNQLSWDDIIPEKERTEAQLTQEDLELLAGRRKYKMLMEESNSQNDEALMLKKKKTNAKRKKSGISTEMTEQDVRALVKAIQRFGDVEMRFDEIVEDAQLEEKTRETVVSVFHEIEAACNEVLRASEDQANADQSNESIHVGQSETVEPKLKSDQADTQASKPTKKPKVLSAVVRGVSVNASQFLVRLGQLRALSERLLEMEEKQTILSFRLRNQLKPVNNWTCIWGQKEDAMLLIGIFRYGFGNWEIIQRDLSLGLRQKFFLTKETMSEDADLNKTLPKALHLSRRAEYLLKIVKEEEDAKPRKKDTKRTSPSSAKKTAGVRASARVAQSAVPEEPNGLDQAFVTVKEEEEDRDGDYGSKPTGSKKKKTKAPAPKKVPPIKIKKPSTKKASSSAVAEESSYESMDEKECKAELRPMKIQLKLLRDKQDFTDSAEKGKFLKDSLTAIGRHIDAVSEKIQDESERKKKEKHLWKFASWFWPSNISSGIIRNMYYKWKTSLTSN